MNIKRTHLLSYLAGFFDGEGCISIYPQCQTGNGTYFKLVVSVGQKDRTILNLFQLQFGGKVTHYGHIFRWALYSDIAADFCEVILPYLFGKAEQAKVAVEFQRAKRRYCKRTEKEKVLEEAQMILCRKMKHG